MPRATMHSIYTIRLNVVGMQTFVESDRMMQGESYFGSAYANTQKKVPHHKVTAYFILSKVNNDIDANVDIVSD